MCGIVGIARRIGEQPVTPADIRPMCDSIRHRGPDDEGIYAHGRVGLGMRRLSIIDLQGGHQPIFNEDGTNAIVFNGEIYNYAELRADLLARGHQLRTNSDTETIVHLYEDHGVDCVKWLRGMFAFGLWDETRRQLVLARDRFGIKPLYVAMDGRQVSFASELKALCAANLTKRELDWPALEAYFRLGYVPAPHTPFRDVRKLEPGHVLVWREDGTWIDRPYWDVPLEPQLCPADIEERVRDWLDESVKAHLVSDVPLAVLLSGGIDSSAIFSSMALSGAAPHGYTARYIGSGAKDADESALAAQLANCYGAKLTVVDIEPCLTDILEPIALALDEPHADESAVPTWLMSERVARDYKVVLAGTGGDELFAGYRRHFGLLMTEQFTRLPASLRRALSSAIGLLPEPSSGKLTLHRLKRFLRSEPGTLPERYLDLLNKLPSGVRSIFTEDIVRQIGSGLASTHFSHLYDAAGSPKGLSAPLYLDYKTYLPDDILHLSDRISMAHSLEVRVPFVDHRFVEQAFMLPDAVKVGRGKAKHLLRKSLVGRLPKAHFQAPKRGFVGPTALWLRSELRGVLLDELSSDRMSRLGFFDTRAVARLINEHLDGRQNHESVLWALLSFSIWHRIYCEEPIPAADAVRSPAVALQ
jgi:asparagine synthase (glutamine-hydrolysing)